MKTNLAFKDLARALLLVGTLNFLPSTGFGQNIITITNPTPAFQDQFGVSVAAVGTDRVLIGAHQDDTGATNTGAAYLFSTNGTLLVTITNPAPANSDNFGFSLAAVGNNRLLIGAHSDDTGATNAGAAYLFSTNGTLLITITNPTPANNDLFGYAVAAVGNDRVLIGAHQDDTGANLAGVAYLFSTNGMLLTTFTNPAPFNDDEFGFSLAAVGNDRVLIGAYLDDTGAMNAGAAYLFSTNGTLLVTITNPTPAFQDIFGYSVAAVGSNRLLIGARQDNTGATAAGTAYLFSTNGTLLITFTNPTPASAEGFGVSVAAVGTDKVLIGAYQESSFMNSAGAAYLFSTNGTLLTTYINPAAEASDLFGNAVAALGTNRVLIGAFQADTSVANAGEAYLFGANVPPFFVRQPGNQTVSVSSNATFTVLAAGSPAGYQWRFNDTNIAGATNASYTRANAQFAHAGNYTVVLTNNSGSVTSVVATLAVVPFGGFNPGVPALQDGSMGWGDFDNDGRLDILVAGTASGAQILRNTASGFTNINAGLPVLLEASAAWGDYDNDGWLDFLVTGQTNNVGFSRLWHNDGGTFTEIPTILPGVFRSSVAWGDYDNDGRLDILLAGSDGFTSICQIWRNVGDDSFAEISAGLPGIQFGSVAWRDYDNDGWLDILLAGASASGRITQIWRNTGSGFTNINAGLPGVQQGSVAWGDYDNDGRSDVLLAGLNTNSVGISQVWRNTATGFTNINAGLPGVNFGSVAWGDYDNDGRPDILLAGLDTNVVGISQVWRNTGSGFTNINAGLMGVYRGSVAWGDYDNDGRLDFLLAGLAPIVGAIATGYRNNHPATNTFPTAPSGLTTTIAGSNLIMLSWNAAADGQTPAPGLSYNIRVGSFPGGGNVVGPMAATTGYRRVPRSGKAGSNLTAFLPIVFGQTNYCSVQAVDSAFAGSLFSAEVTVKLLQWAAPPIIVPLNISSLPIGDFNGNGVLDDGELNGVLTNYFASSPWLHLTNVAGLGGTNVTFALTNSIAGAFSVEFSTNLINWQFLGPATPRYEFNDPDATNTPLRYYRLRWP